MGPVDAGGSGRGLDEAAASPGLHVLRGPRGVGRSTALRARAAGEGWTAATGLELLADVRHLVVSRLARTDLTEASVADAVGAVRAAVPGPIAVDDAQDVDGASLDVLAALAGDRPVVLGWRDDAGPPPPAATVTTHPPLGLLEAEDLARAHGGADPEAVAWRAGGVPGLVLALCGGDGSGDDGAIAPYRASLERRLGALAADERRALAVLHAASAPTLRGWSRTWLPRPQAGQVERLVADGFVVERDGEVQLAHGLAGELAWQALTLDDRLEVRRSLTGARDPLVVVEQLHALGDTTAAIERAREAATDATPLATSRLRSFVADQTGAPADHEAAARAAVRLTDGQAVARHAEHVDPDRTAVRVAQAERLAGRIDRAQAALLDVAGAGPDAGAGVDAAAGVVADEDGELRGEIDRERRHLSLRALDDARAALALVGDEADPPAAVALSSLAELAEGRVPAAADLHRVVEAATAVGDLDAAVLALAVAAAGAVSGTPDLAVALDRLVAVGADTGAPLAREAARMRPVVAFHAGSLGAAVAEQMADLAGPVAAMHRVLALALAGRTGDAAALIDDEAWPTTALWDSVRGWLRAECALLGGRLVTCRTLADEVAALVPATTATVDLARLAAARADVEGGETVTRFEPASFLAGPVAAELAALAADGADRAAALHAAADAWSGRHHPAALRCRIAAHAAEGSSAVVDLEAVTDEADGLGFRVLAATGRRALRRAGTATGASTEAGSGLLSPREREVLGHVAEGASSREIANLLGVASSTVDTQVKSAMQKLGARTRRQAAAMMLDGVDA